MAESRAFTHALAAVVGFIKDAEQATFALYRISCPPMPVADQSLASNLRAFDISLNILLPRMKSEADVNLAAQRISEKLESLTASSGTSQECQQATSSSSSPSSAQVVTSSASAEAEPTSSVKLEAPQTPSATSALAEDSQPQRPQTSASSTASLSSSEADSTTPVGIKAPQTSSITPSADISQPQKSSTSSPSATSPRSVEPEQSAPINSVKSNLSSTTPATKSIPRSERASASAQSSILPLSVRAVSPAHSPVHSVVKKPSAAPALPNIVQSQHPLAPATTPQTSPAQANGHPTPPNAQQSLAPASAPQPSRAQPSRPLHSADQLTASPCSLQPTHNPALGASLVPELAVRVGTYQGSTCVVVSKLIEHGGRNHEPPLNKQRRVPKTKKLFYLDYFRNERSMDVQRNVFMDHNGWGIDIPRVTCHQHLDLYNSMIHSNPDDLKEICRKILVELEIAIVNRAAVYKWYESLPPTDGRVAYNPRHLAFLQMFEKLESAINRYLHTDNLQLIRR